MFFDVKSYKEVGTSPQPNDINVKITAIKDNIESQNLAMMDFLRVSLNNLGDRLQSVIFTASNNIVDAINNLR